MTESISIFCRKQTTLLRSKMRTNARSSNRMLRTLNPMRAWQVSLPMDSNNLATMHLITVNTSWSRHLVRVEQGLTKVMAVWQELRHLHSWTKRTQNLVRTIVAALLRIVNLLRLLMATQRISTRPILSWGRKTRSTVRARRNPQEVVKCETEALTPISCPNRYGKVVRRKKFLSIEATACRHCSYGQRKSACRHPKKCHKETKAHYEVLVMGRPWAPRNFSTAKALHLTVVRLPRYRQHSQNRLRTSRQLLTFTV